MFNYKEIEDIINDKYYIQVFIITYYVWVVLPD